LRQDNFWYY